jgi:hypothetical protein
MKTTRLWIPIGIACTAVYMVPFFAHGPNAFPGLDSETIQILGHLLVYSVLGLFVARFLTLATSLRTTLVILIAVDLCAAFGIYDEYHQSFVTDRGFEFSDVLVDAAGGLIGALLYSVWAYTKHRIFKLRLSPSPPPGDALKQGIIALHVFLLVFIPAALYSSTVAQYIDSARISAPALAETAITRYLGPHISHDTEKLLVGKVRALASPIRNPIRTKQEAKDSDRALREFVQVASQFGPVAGDGLPGLPKSAGRFLHNHSVPHEKEYSPERRTIR